MSRVAVDTLFRRQDFSESELREAVAPLVTAKTLLRGPAIISRGCSSAAPRERRAQASNPLEDVEVRAANRRRHASIPRITAFDIRPASSSDEPRVWLVRVTDITARVQAARELEDLRAQVQTQGEILRGVLQTGGAALRRLPAEHRRRR